MKKTCTDIYMLIVSGVAMGVMILFYLFIVSSKTPDLVPAYLVSVIPPALGCLALLTLSSRGGDALSCAAVLMFAFLLICGSAYQTVLGVNGPLKVFLIDLLGLAASVGALTLYIFVIKKKVLVSKRGYEISVCCCAGAMLLLFLVLLVFGQNIGGARLWLSFGPLTIELSEIIKLLFYILLALIYNSNAGVKRKIIYGAAATAASAGFLFLLNEFGTVLIMFSVYLITFFIHIRSRYSLMMVGGMIVIMAAALGIIFGTHDSLKESGGFFADKLNKIYARLTLEDSDQLTRGLQGMINGGMLGADPGYIIYVFSIEADFALAGLAQYFGLINMLLCIIAAGAVVYIVYLKGRDEELNNRSRYKLSFIFTCAFAVQAIFAIGGNIGVLPCAGVGMPALSAGGTQTVVLYTEIAFIIFGLIGNADDLSLRSPSRSSAWRYYDVESEI